MTAIENKSTDDLKWWLIAWVVSIAIATPVQVFYGYFRTRLALVWRDWLSKDLFNSYFARQIYLKLTRRKDVDNPDQRMAQDTDSFANSAIGLFISILDALVNVIMFIGVLWSFSGTLTLTVVLYAGAGSVIVYLIGRSLVDLAFQQFKTEGDLRFGLGEVRREAESIAMYRGEGLAKHRSRLRLERVIATLMRIMNVNRNMQLFTNPFYALVPVIPPAILASIYFAGGIKFGEITQATMAFHPAGQTVNDDSRLVQILALVDLADLPARAQGFDTETNWREMLSASQLQRLGLARIINLKPKSVPI